MTGEKSPIIIQEGNNQLNEPQDVCEAFNKYFIRTSQELYMQEPINHHYLDTINIQNNFAVPLRSVTQDAIRKAIDCLKAGAAAGNDRVSAKFLIRYKDRLIAPITNCINKSINDGVYPDSLKCAAIVPILKSGDPTNCGNYRPISVLSALNMIFEEILKNWLTSLMEANNTIHPHQFGFTKNSNTEAAVLNMTHFIGKNVQEGYYTAVIFLDLKKAFDSVDHRILLYKLGKLGLSDKENSLISSYLQKRKQVVKIGTSRSGVLDAPPIAVPQGSKLGPILFNYGINDMHDLVTYGVIQQFADDTAVMYRAKNLNQLQQDMSHDIGVISEWLANNHLYVNTDKTKYMIFTRSEKGAKIIEEHGFKLEWANQEIERVRAIKFLGIIIDDKLSWDKQVDKIRKEIAPYVFALRKMRPFITQETATIIYNAYIISKLAYISPAWRTAPQHCLQRLRVLQHSALKTIHRLPWLTSTHLLFSAQHLNIDNILIHRLLIFIHKVINNEIRHTFNLQQPVDIHDHATRSRNNYITGRRGGRTEEANVLRYGLTLYNQLPATIKTAASPVFKKILRVHLSTLNL